MSENKEYVTRCEEQGNVYISEEVLAGISAAAALEIEGVSGLTANLGSDIAELLGKKSLAKGVSVKTEDDKVVVTLSILMAYGHTIPEVGKAVQEAVKNAVESMTGLEVSAVNVNVAGISLQAHKEQQ
ncbi:MAG: Asp23/Gls24 family envelope stress response protein [Clostridiales bacterium]|nr:Asp23/Gls24 family envelope stress response protein [Clostridiales bacterium]